MIKQSFKNSPTQKGVVITEYVLLLVVVVSIATLLTNIMVSRDQDSPGFIINKWSKIINFIGEDFPDSSN